MNNKLWGRNPPKSCVVCGSTYNIHKHHVFHGTANRKLSEKYGLVIDLCIHHHLDHKDGIHFNRELDLRYKKEAQEKFESEYGRDEFMKVFGRNYL